MVEKDQIDGLDVPSVKYGNIPAEKNNPLTKTLSRAPESSAAIVNAASDRKASSNEQKDSLPTDPSILVQVYNSNPISGRIKSNREKESEQMLFSNKYDMLDHFSKVVSSRENTSSLEKRKDDNSAPVLATHIS